MSADPVLVTGGAGFIGSALVDLLVRTGSEVRVLDGLSRGRVENLPAQGCSLIEGDVRDFETVGGVARACHLAAQVPEAAGRIINGASGRQTRLNEVMARCAGRKLDVAHLPARAGEVRHSVASLALARLVLGFEPGTGLEAGLRLTLDAAEARIEEPAVQRSGR